MQAYMLTPKQVFRRTAFVSGCAGLTFFYFYYQITYVKKKESIFNMEYQMLKNNPNMYHSLHEEVALGHNEKEQEESEKLSKIDFYRENLIRPNAKGIVLETCVGTNSNRKFYEEAKIRKIIGLDWVPSNIIKAN